MSLDYKLFLRDQPDLAAYARTDEAEEADDDDVQRILEDEGNGNYVLGAMRVWAAEYWPHEDDPLIDCPWRDEIRWVVASGGRHNDDDFDDFHALMYDLGTKYRGGLWCDHGDDLEWYWWDREGLAAKAERWSYEELSDVLWWARGARKQSGGVLDQVAELVLGRLASCSVEEREKLIAALWGAKDSLGKEVRDVVGDALLALGSADVRKAQADLEHERALEAEKKVPLPTTREALAELYDRAANDQSAWRILTRGLSESDGSEFMRAEFGALLLERARAGASKPSWMWFIGAWPQLKTAPEKTDREAFAKLGSLAASIVKDWNESDAYVAKLGDMLERRRRGGEMFAGIPDDIRALATSGKRTEAYKAYAQRYGVSIGKAKQVVDANH